MNKIGDFLGRFIKLAQDSDMAREAVMQALASNGIKIRELNTISIKNSIVSLKISPVQKSEVFLKQKKIIAELAKNPLTKNITVVR